MPRFNAFRDGRVHVCADMCPTCVFRPGNLMRLSAGRLRQMIEDAQADESSIICHATLYSEKDNAVCRGFYDRYPTQPLQIASRLGLIAWDEVKSPSRGLDESSARGSAK